jgi:hypothetical protein
MNSNAIRRVWFGVLALPFLLAAPGLIGYAERGLFYAPHPAHAGGPIPPHQAATELVELAQSTLLDGTADKNLIITFGIQSGQSLRDSYVNIEILRILLRNSFTDVCRIDITSEEFGKLHIVFSGTITERRACTERASDIVLREAPKERAFRSARDTAAHNLSLWITPKSRNLILVGAALRLALIGIYEQDSPLNQIIGTSDYHIRSVSFDAFWSWMRNGRERGEITLERETTAYGESSLNRNVNVISLSSPRIEERVLFFDGDTVGVDALLMIKVPLRIDGPLLFESGLWRRFCGKEGKIVLLGEPLAVSCQSQSYWETDAWLSLTLRRQSDSISEFCRGALSLLADEDVNFFVNSVPEKDRGIYIALPRECKTPHTHPGND